MFGFADQFLTTPAVLDRTARKLPDHPALITPERTLSFAELRHEVRRAAAAMIARDIRAGDRVAICSPNSWRWVVAALGAQYAGAVLVPINPNFNAAEAADVLARSGARLLFDGVDRAGGVDRAALPALLDIVRVPAGADGAIWAEFLDGPSVALSRADTRAAAVRPDDLSDILFTSGTTGRSKGVMCTHRQSLSASASGAECRDPRPDDRFLCLAPFSHTFGYKAGILSCLLTGGTLVTQRSFDIEKAMGVIAEHSITILPGSPTLLQVFLDHPVRAQYDLSSVRLVATGGSQVPAELVARIHRELGVETVLTGYGLTEGSGYGAMTRFDDDPARAASTCGRPMAGFEIRIESPDDDGAGEILMRGPNVMLGYLDDPEATADAIDDDGWLHTGDIGTVDAAGYLRITDRVKDVFICGGMNVYPAEIEQVLAGLDGVADAAVIGVPDPRLGEVGRAFVVRRPESDIEANAVIAHLRTHLANFKVPRSVVFVEELPRNLSGKVLKTDLRETDPGSAPPVWLTPKGLGGPPIGPVEAWVADAWQVLLNISRPGRRDKFVDLGGDSLAAVDFSQMLHTQFGVRISVDSLAHRPTIAAVVAGLEPGSGEQRQPVVQLRDDDSGPVCLMVPGIGGHAWRFTSLAGALRGPCDVRALSPVDLRDAVQTAGGIRDRIRDAAREALRDAVAAGRPIVVAGYSFGGTIATDLACWLPGHGVPVTRLVLLDPDPLDSAARDWDPRTSRSSETFLVFTPGSPAARQLEDEIVEVTGLLQSAYLDGSIRLPELALSWVQSETMAIKHRSETALFGRPIAELDRTLLDVDHLEMMRIPQVYEVARWLDQQL